MMRLKEGLKGKDEDGRGQISVSRENVKERRRSRRRKKKKKKRRGKKKKRKKMMMKKKRRCGKKRGEEEEQVEQSSDNRCVLWQTARDLSLNRLLNGIISCS